MITTLSQLIEQVESNGNPYAIRYEIAYNPKRVGEMAKLCNCTKSTAAILCASSFGLFQIMGDTLIDLGLDVSPIRFCNDVNLQAELFNDLLVGKKIDFTLGDIMHDTFKRALFARKYNGPGNIAAYSERLLDFATRLTQPELIPA